MGLAEQLRALAERATPGAWLYTRKPGAYPSAKPMLCPNRWPDSDPAKAYWTEAPLFTLPTIIAALEAQEKNDANG